MPREVIVSKDPNKNWANDDIQFPRLIAEMEAAGWLEGEGLVAFRYSDPSGAITPDANPNGSRNNIAGIYNPSGTVLGLMPHPERLADAPLGGTDGAKMFLSLVETLH